MRKVYCIGETVYDIIFKNDVPIHGCPGGSMLNTAVSLGRCGIISNLITEYASDQTGRLIDNFLYDNKVGIEYISKYDDGQTAIALAFLDEYEHATYEFLKNYPKIRMQINIPEFSKSDIVVFGSYHSLIPEVRNKIIEIVIKAKNSGAIIIYDPNIRKKYSENIEYLKELIKVNIDIADIVKGSDEDFQNIFKESDIASVYKLISNDNCNLIYTMGKDGCILKNNEFEIANKSKKINPLSTIGAGDNFTAGLIYSLIINNIFADDLDNLTENQWIELLSEASEFASEVCMNKDNYISNDFAKIKSMKLSQTIF